MERAQKKRHRLTGVKKDSATNLALAFNCSPCQQALETAFQSTYEEFHLRNLLVNLLHELYNEIHQLVLQHLLCMEIRNQERNIISLQRTESAPFHLSLPSLRQ